MARFYLCRVWKMTRDSDGAVRWVTEMDRYVTEDWTVLKHDSTTVSVKFPYWKYQDVSAHRVYDSEGEDKTVALVRVDGTLDTGDYNIDMTDRSAGQWNTMYQTYPNIAAHPFTDAPYQP